MRVDIELAGDVQLSRELLRFADRVVDATPAFRQIADDLRADETSQFESQGAYGSGGWAPLAASTVLRKAALGLDARILHATGALRASLTQHDPDHVEIVRPDELIFGTTVPYAKYHQTGTDRMPRRRPLELPARARAGAVKTLQRYLVEGLT